MIKFLSIKSCIVIQEVYYGLVVRLDSQLSYKSRDADRPTVLYITRIHYPQNFRSSPIVFLFDRFSYFCQNRCPAESFISSLRRQIMDWFNGILLFNADWFWPGILDNDLNWKQF